MAQVALTPDEFAKEPFVIWPSAPHALSDQGSRDDAIAPSMRSQPFAAQDNGMNDRTERSRDSSAGTIPRHRLRPRMVHDGLALCNDKHLNRRAKFGRGPSGCADMS